MWKEITDAQRYGEIWLVSHCKWMDPVIADYHDNIWVDVYSGEHIADPTHYWDFGLDTPLPPPPKGE